MQRESFNYSLQSWKLTSNQPIRKRYFVTDTLITEYPPEFTASKNTKYVHVLSINVYLKNDSSDPTILLYWKPNYMTVHCDIVQDSAYLDSYICIANEPLYNRKNYEQFRDAKTMKIWFKDFTGMSIDMTNVCFIAIFMLEF